LLANGIGQRSTYPLVLRFRQQAGSYEFGVHHKSCERRKSPVGARLPANDFAQRHFNRWPIAFAGKRAPAMTGATFRP
jgi:hypothetical protein